MTKKPKKTKPGPEPERLVIEGDPEEALGRLLRTDRTKGVRRLPDLPEDKQPVRFWTADGPPEGQTGIFRAKGKLGKSKGEEWAFEADNPARRQYREAVRRWQPL